MRTYIRNYKSAQGLGPILVSKIMDVLKLYKFIKDDFRREGGGGQRENVFEWEIMRK